MCLDTICISISYTLYTYLIDMCTRKEIDIILLRCAISIDACLAN